MNRRSQNNANEIAAYYDAQRAKAKAKGGAMKKKVQLKSAVEYHDIRHDPYVVKPKLQIPETQSK